MKQYPGFDVLRIAAAIAVVFSHSFLIAQETELNEPLQKATGEIIGVYGVMIFFLLSGFLVSDSALRSVNVKVFAKKRARRILPAFIFCNLVAVVGIAPWFAKTDALGFLSEADTWTSVLSVLSFYDSTFILSNVQFYHTATNEGSYLETIVNGVLWTIRLEIICYVFVGLLLWFGLLTLNCVLVFSGVAAVTAFSYSIQINQLLGGLCFLFPSFVGGMLLRMIAYNHETDWRIAGLSFAILCAFAFLQPQWQKFEAVLFPLLFAYPLLWFGRLDIGMFSRLRSLGDPSYGIYLWGWPIQQMLRSWCGPDWSGYAFFFLCFPVVMIAGYASWHLVEARFLRRSGTGSI